jgi:hypothetical protein
MLWPVLVVLVAHVALALAGLLLAVQRSRGPFAIAGLVLLTAASAAVLRHDLARRRLGALGATLLASWALGVLTAWAADRFGLL